MKRKHRSHPEYIQGRYVITDVLFFYCFREQPWRTHLFCRIWPSAGECQPFAFPEDYKFTEQDDLIWINQYRYETSTKGFPSKKWKHERQALLLKMSKYNRVFKDCNSSKYAPDNVVCIQGLHIHFIMNRSLQDIITSICI